MIVEDLDSLSIEDRRDFLKYSSQEFIELNNSIKSHCANGGRVIFIDSERKIIWADGDNQPHREDGPAIECKDGRKEWWIHGKKHREDEPAIECKDGRKEWWLSGERHREDGPAILKKDGSKQWWVNDELHREDGPAYEDSDGLKVWYLHGKLHREDGPAVEKPDGHKEWWLEGVQYTEEEFNHVSGKKVMTESLHSNLQEKESNKRKMKV